MSGDDHARAGGSRAKRPVLHVRDAAGKPPMVPGATEGSERLREAVERQNASPVSAHIEHAKNLLDCMAPREWDVAVWLPTANYLTGRVDPADRQRLVVAVLELLQAEGR